ncbi:hypothetical protein ACFS07_10915 [Undibacterium arcticum]
MIGALSALRQRHALFVQGWRIDRVGALFEPEGRLLYQLLEFLFTTKSRPMAAWLAEAALLFKCFAVQDIQNAFSCSRRT